MLLRSYVGLIVGLIASCAPLSEDMQRVQRSSAARGSGATSPSQASVSEPLASLRNFERTGLWLVEPKIVGGTEAKAGDDPWQVALLDGQKSSKNAHFCGGTRINARWVVTAAHCVDGGTQPSDVDVLAGTTNVRSGGERLDVQAIFVHPDYDTSRDWTIDADVALLHLAAPATQGGTIETITAAEDSQHGVPPTLSRVTGWGATLEGGGLVSRLRTVNLPIISRQDCNNRVVYNGEVTDNMICAGRWEGGQDACQGDSGGPLTVPVPGGRRLAGVVSSGRGCARRLKYGVYTRVANYRQWIDQCIAGGPCPKLD